MAYIKEKITKSGFYYYLVESHRVNGNVKKHETYIGTNIPKGINRPSPFDRMNNRLCPECRARIKAMDKILEEGAEQSVEICPKCEAAIDRLMSTLRILKDKGIRGTGLPKNVVPPGKVGISE